MPICYIPKLDPIQEALEKKKKPTYCKLTLQLTKSEMSVAQWASGTPEQFLLHVHTAIHACKQMELDGNFSMAKEAVTIAECDLKIAKEAYAQVCTSEKKKKKKGNPEEAAQAESKSLVLAKAEYKQAKQAVTVAKLTITMEGAKAFKLYGNLLSNEERPAWEKIIKAQMIMSP